MSINQLKIKVMKTKATFIKTNQVVLDPPVVKYNMEEEICKLKNVLAKVDYLQNEGVIFASKEVEILENIIHQLDVTCCTIKTFNVR
jgi:phosphomevalonate kinase